MKQKIITVVIKIVYSV